MLIFFQCQNKMYKKCIAMQNVMFVNNATVFQLKLKQYCTIKTCNFRKIFYVLDISGIT